MIFDEAKLNSYPANQSGSGELITYQLGTDDNPALAFLLIFPTRYVAIKVGRYFDVIYVGIIEGPNAYQMRYLDVAEKFWNSTEELSSVENASPDQADGFKPFTYNGKEVKNVFPAKNAVAAYNRFQDLIFEFEQSKKYEEDQ